jgi:hypothetical protein
MSTGHNKVADQALSKAHIDEAISTLLKLVGIDNKHWIPYLGGYSKDWDKHPEVYFDERFPDTLKVGGKVMQPYRYILIHECVEKSLIDRLGLSYEVAHDFATGAEKSAVEADGFNWAMYTHALRPYIREVVNKPTDLEAPKDLDLTPYVQEHSKDVPKLEATEDTLPS